MNKKYSYQNFMNKDFLKIDAKEFNNSEIIGTCFAQEYNEITKKDIFPKGMIGVKFIKCNLDNVVVPEGNTMEECVNKSIQVQNDNDDWVLDEAGNPTEPISKELRIEKGVSIDPKDIPKTKLNDK